jgi:hypothetical protein
MSDVQRTAANSTPDHALATSGRRAFLGRAGMAAGGAALLGLSSMGSFATAFASSTSLSPDTTQDILNAALTAEQLATTFYYRGLVGPNAENLVLVHNQANLNYFQAAVWQEHEHAALFSSVGAVSLAGSSPAFYFPTGTFKSDASFLAVLDALETAFIGAYLAAIGEWAGDSANAVASTGSFTPPQLAKIAGQIMGTEAEHRALGRVTLGVNPPNNLIYEAAPYVSVGSPTNASGTAVGTLLPFVTGGSGFSGPFALPSTEKVRDAAGKYTNLVNPGLAGP